MTEEGLRALVVDDDPAARAHLAGLLRALGASRVDEASSAVEAVAAVTGTRYDAVFLDVRMPGLDGLSALRVVNRLPHAPRVVLVTAHAEHAVEAFAEAAADYLLKPVTEERLRRTLTRLGPTHAPLERLPVRQGERVILLDTADIRYVVALGDGSAVATADATYPTAYTLGELERRLPRATFLRVHRSYLVNIDHVKEVRPFFKGAFLLRMDDRRASEIPVSRRQAAKLRVVLGF